MKQLFTYSPPLFLLTFWLCITNTYAQAERDIYEIKVYHVVDKEQESRLDEYLEKAFIPGMHSAGIDKIGVFKPIESDSLYGKRVFVLSPYSSMKALKETSGKLMQDEEYLKAGTDYLDASLGNAPYQRFETILLEAFAGMPHYDVPKLEGPKEKRVYELRSYESPTELLFHNKVKMFNDGEIEIFDNLGFNAVFYGEVLAGSRMPNLMYMTSFEDLTSEKEKWKNFGNDPAWIKMRDMEEYQGNVSHIDIFLLYPTEYSDL